MDSYKEVKRLEKVIEDLSNKAAVARVDDFISKVNYKDYLKTLSKADLISIIGNKLRKFNQYQLYAFIIT